MGSRNVCIINFLTYSTIANNYDAPKILSNDPHNVIHPLEFKHKILHSAKQESRRSASPSRNRTQTFLDILNNKANDNESRKYMFYDLSGIVGGIFSTSIYTLIPHHNIILHPQYWITLSTRNTIQS